MYQFRFSRFVPAFLAFFLLTGAIVYAHSDTQPDGWNFWAYSEYQSQLYEEDRKGVDLDRHLSENQELFAMNDQLLDEVIADRMTVAEAVAKKWETNKHRGDWYLLVSQYPRGGTLQEKMTCHLIDLVLFKLKESPESDVATLLIQEMCEIEAGNSETE